VRGAPGNRRPDRDRSIAYLSRKEDPMPTNSISDEEARDQVDTGMMAWRVHEFGPPDQCSSSAFRGRIPAPAKS
jgi:hypothetical protein